MLSKEDVEKIKEMSTYVVKEQIAEVYEIPISMVEDVLNGNIIGEDAKYQEQDSGVKIVERPKFVRNKTISSISSGGGAGKTCTLSSLAVFAALNIPGGRPVAVIDLSEHNNLFLYFGISPTEKSIIPGLTCCSSEPGQNELLDQLAITHPYLENLYLIPAVTVFDQYRDITPGQALKVIEAAQKYFEAVFVDLPHRLDIIDGVLQYSDSVLTVCRDDYQGIDGVSKLFPTLHNAGREEDMLLIVNRTENSGIKPGTFQKQLRELLEKEINVTTWLPYEKKFSGWINGTERQHPVLDSESDYSTEIKKLALMLFPHWTVKEQHKGLLKTIVESIKR